MKAFLSGIFGAMIVGLAFFCGVVWERGQGQPSRPFARYEMHVDASGVYRLDKTTGTIHVVGTSGGKAVATDLPEHLAPSATPVVSR